MTEFAAAMKDDDWWAGFDEPAAIKRASVALARGDNPAVDYGYEEATGAFQTQHSDDEEEEEPHVKEPDWQEQQKSKLQTIISRRRGSVAGSLASGNSGGSGGSGGNGNGNGKGTASGVSGARSGSPIPTRSNHSAGSRRSSCTGSSGEPLVRRERSRGGHKERPPHQSASAASSSKTRPSRSRSNSGDDPIISREEPHSSSSRVDPRRASRSKSRSRSLGRRQSLAAVSTTSRCASPTPPPPSSKSPTATTRRPTVRRAKTMDDDSLQELAQLAAAAPSSSSRREKSPPPPPSCARGTTNMATTTANHRRLKMRRSMSIGCHITTTATPLSEPQPPRSPPRSDERRSMMKRKNSLKNLGALAGGGSGSFRRTHATPGTPVVGDEISIDETAQALFLDDDDDSHSSHDQDPATTPAAKPAVPHRRSMDTAANKSRRDTLRKSVSDRRNKPKQTQHPHHQHALDSKNKSHSLSKLQKFKDLGQQHYQLRHKMAGTDHSNNAHVVNNDDDYNDNSHDNDNSYSHDDDSESESDSDSEGSLCEQHLVHPLRKPPSHNRNHNSKTRVGIGSLANNLSANNNNNSATNNSKNFLLDGSLDLQQAITVVNNNNNNSSLNITEKAQKLKELSDSYKKTTSQLMQRGTVKK